MPSTPVSKPPCPDIPYLITHTIHAVFPWAEVLYTETPRGAAMCDAHIGERHRIKVEIQPVNVIPRTVNLWHVSEDKENTVKVLGRMTIRIDSPHPNAHLTGFLSKARMVWNETTLRTLPQGATTRVHGLLVEQIGDTKPPYDTPSTLKLRVNPSFSVNQTPSSLNGMWVWEWVQKGRKVQGMDNIHSLEEAITDYIRAPLSKHMNQAQGYLTRAPNPFRENMERILQNISMRMRLGYCNSEKAPDL